MMNSYSPNGSETENLPEGSTATPLSLFAQRTKAEGRVSPDNASRTVPLKIPSCARLSEAMKRSERIKITRAIQWCI
jgi:hypothetical protein